MSTPAIAVRDLRVGYPTDAGLLHAVRGVDLHVAPGERVGVVGESGSGKSTIVSAMLGLLPRDTVVAGDVQVGATTIEAGDRERLAALRGRTVAVVPQGAMAGLHPAYRVGRQIAEVIRVHDDVGSAVATQRVEELLAAVGLDERARRAFPHELSGGMRQRVVLAAALAASPSVVIADEPTVGLDPVVASQFLQLLLERQTTDGFGLVVVSHDTPVVAAVSERLVVAYAGEVVEAGPTAELVEGALHPYSSGLFAAAPRLGGRAWAAIPGHAPDLTVEQRGCSFAPRCPHRFRECDHSPTATEVAHRTVRCHLHAGRQHASGFAVSEVAFPTVATSPRHREESLTRVAASELAVRISGASKTYRSRRGFRSVDTHALVDVDLDVHRGEAIGLVGQSGSGKSTLARLLFGLVEPDAGSVTVDGVEIGRTTRASLRSVRHRLALVHQDPYASLHPGMRVSAIVEEPLTIIGTPRPERRNRVVRALRLAGLEPSDDLLGRFPDQLSGGQRQRVALARAMVIDPSVLVLDEPMSMLDASVRAGLAAALVQAREHLGAAVVLITHDLAEAAGICDRIVVMEGGRIVEDRSAGDIVDDPSHEATKLLLRRARHPFEIGDGAVARHPGSISATSASE